MKAVRWPKRKISVAEVFLNLLRKQFSDNEKLDEESLDTVYTEQIDADVPTGDIHGFVRDVGVRETVESIVIAIILALMFRAFEAEAFIIPTGSMAPSLTGQHMDLECENCNVRYHSGATGESSTAAKLEMIDSTFCPICQYRTRMKQKNLDHRSNNGDRILVNKFIYDFKDPERFDVIVFKNPNQGDQNYIKRLIGLPGDNILIENGDIFLMNPKTSGGWTKEIARKPAQKLRHTLLTVDDTDHVGEKLIKVDWPSRWQSFEDRGNWSVEKGPYKSLFSSDSTQETNWIRYRHFQPMIAEWSTISNGSLPEQYRNGELPKGRLIGDKYGYNDGLYERETNALGQITHRDFPNFGLHWVGDLGMEVWADVKSDTGTLTLDLVEGGAHLQCAIDVGTGLATLSCDDSHVKTKVTFEDNDGNAVTTAPTGQTSIRGQGSYRILFLNADDQLHLWIDNQLVAFDNPFYSRTGIPVPTYSPEDPGDAEPAGIGAKGVAVDVQRIKMLRDIYYTSTKNPMLLANETGYSRIDQIEALQRHPESWSSDKAVNFFESQKGLKQPMFELKTGETPEKDQFLPMGDNSPRSLDGRVWDGPKYVERDMLIGRAMLIYWPHTKNKPFPFFPNFERMGFIR